MRFRYNFYKSFSKASAQTNFSSENNLPKLRLNAPVVIRAKDQINHFLSDQGAHILIHSSDESGIHKGADGLGR